MGYEKILISASSILTFSNLLYCLTGTILGTIVGVLPGLSATTTMLILLPLTYTLDPLGSIVMLCAIYYGAQYAGSTSAICFNVPGEGASVVTCIDGHQMYKSGFGYNALQAAALASFIAGCFSVLVIVFFTNEIASISHKVSSVEMTIVITFVLILSCLITNSQMLPSISAIILGLLLSSIGTENNSSVDRFTFSIPELYDGIEYTAVLMGMLAIPELLEVLGQKNIRTSVNLKKEISALKQLRNTYAPITRGTLVGSVFGLLPGGGTTLSTFVSYYIEKILKNKDTVPVGKGNIRAVAAPEAANNSAAQVSLIPLLALGVPDTTMTTVLLGVLTMHDIIPGPLFMSNNPDMFWGFIASLFIGNILLLILNLPLVKVWLKLFNIHYSMLFILIMSVCLIGIFSLTKNTFVILLLIFFSIMGTVFKLLEIEPLGFLLAFMLGPVFEENFRRTMLIYDGDYSVFINNQLSLILGIVLIGILFYKITTFYKNVHKGIS